jgi:hypothetical protein
MPGLSGPIIAERALDVTMSDGTIEKLLVRITAPVMFEDSAGCEYRCHYEIKAPGFSKSRCAAGIDGFQALQLVFKIIGVDLECIARENGCRITFEGSENTGFPDYEDRVV